MAKKNRTLEAAMRATIFCSALLAHSAFAQQSVIEHCKNTSSDADRIACLEAALLGKEALETSQPEVAETVAPVAIAAAMTVTPDPEPKPEPKPLPRAEPEGIGASQVIASTQTKDELVESLEKAIGLVVASYGTVPYEKLLVTLENGQVWRQITGDTQKIRVDLKRNQTVDIEESSLSGYKMRLNEMRRTVRVRRVQ